MRRIVALTAATCLAMGSGTAGQAQAPQHTAWIAGLPLTCNNWQGIPVEIVANPYLNDVGVAHSNAFGQPVIQLNPYVMNRYSFLVQTWWFAHECGHHALHPSWNSEQNADCWGIRTMRQQGLITRQWQLNAFAIELGNLQGTAAGHLPGPARAANIANCAMT